MDENEDISQNLHMLCIATSTEQELEALRLLNLHLANIHNTASDADFIERQYLTQSKTVLEEGNPYPAFQVTELKFSNSASLKDWVNYIFVRRYGWSEVMPTGEKITVQRIIGDGSSSKDEATMKSDLNELLDEFLKWLLCQKFSHELIFSLQYTVQQAMDHPVIRKQTFIHILEWFRSTFTVFHEEFFEPCKGLIILGLTDVWSAIRSACSSKLYTIAEQFNIKQLEMFFLALVQICRDTESSWQAKEGAVMGLNVIVRRFQWVGSSDSSTSPSADTQNTEYYLKFGAQSLQRIPEFISTKLHDVIFLLLSDPQLSIREHSIKTFSSYLSRCDLQEAMSSFNEVISALCKGTGLSQEEVLKLANISTLVMSDNFCWMNAYLADGLLGMCIFVVKHIPPDCLLPSWSLCMNTLSIYLMHPASTVRQATSKVIKFLVAKDTSNPAILKLILTSLSCNWKVDHDLLSRNCLPENYKYLPESTQVYMEANQIQNPSIKNITSSSAAEETPYAKISRTWEWREGRLLAYELLFQFLTKNHWLYTFGASGAIRSQTNSYFDEHKRSQSPGNHDLLRPLQSYGGVSMQSVKSTSNTTIKGTYNRSLNLREFQRQSQCGSADVPRESVLRPRNERPAMLGMPRPRVTLRRRATMDHLNPLGKTTPVSHHYPYSDKSKSTLKTGDGMNINALPLITAVKQLESSQSDTPSMFFELQAPDSDEQTPEQTSDKALTDKERSRLIKLSEECAMPDLLMNILHQAIECVNSGSWELRRMSLQVLPCLVEVMRWYDMSLLVKFWADNLSPDTSVVSYGASLSFLYSISHAAKLHPLLIDPPDNWLNLQVCKNEVKKIIDCMVTQLSLYIPIFIQVLKRQTLDKLTVIAIEVLLISSSFMSSASLTASTTTASGVMEAVDSIKTITILNHLTGRIQKYKPHMSSNRLLLPGSGFLSCNSLDSDELSVSSQNLLKYLLEHVHWLLVGFVKHCEVKSTYTLLPCLVKFLRSQYSTVHINRSFSDSILLVLDKLSPLIMDPSEENFNMAMRRRVYETKNDSFYELILCITDKTTDKHVLHMAMDCLHGLLQHADSCRYVLPLCKAICSQLSTAQGASHPSRSCADGLEILSNDIRESAEVELVDDSESDDDESDLLELDHQESLALHNSGGTTGSGRQSGLSQRSAGELSGVVSMHSDADSDSDWDSWDEEEEESNDKECAFQEFLQKVYQSFQSQGRLEEFLSSLKKLTQSEYRLVKSLVKI